MLLSLARDTLSPAFKCWRHGRYNTLTCKDFPWDISLRSNDPVCVRKVKDLNPREKVTPEANFHLDLSFRLLSGCRREPVNQYQPPLSNRGRVLGERHTRNPRRIEGAFVATTGAELLFASENHRRRGIQSTPRRPPQERRWQRTLVRNALGETPGRKTKKRWRMQQREGRACAYVISHV